METAFQPKTTKQGNILDSAGAKEKTMFAGILTGQAAGLVMAVVVMAVFTVLGKGPLYPVQVIGSALLGESALQGIDIPAIIVGLILHQAGPSLLWGAVFGLIAKTLRIQTAVGALICGLAIGIVSMVGPYFLIPTITIALHGVDIWNREVPLFWDWAAHLVFGLSFVLFPMVLRRIKTF